MILLEQKLLLWHGQIYGNEFLALITETTQISIYFMLRAILSTLGLQKYYILEY